jgi:hypothetical protein
MHHWLPILVMLAVLVLLGLLRLGVPDLVASLTVGALVISGGAALLEGQV